MGALQYLAECGLDAKALPLDKLDVFPAERLNDQLREWIREHKPEILAELSEHKRRWYRVTIEGKVICKMIGSQPMTYQEAVRAVKWRWPEAEIEC